MTFEETDPGYLAVQKIRLNLVNIPLSEVAGLAEDAWQCHTLFYKFAHALDWLTMKIEIPRDTTLTQEFDAKLNIVLDLAPSWAGIEFRKVS